MKRKGFDINYEYLCPHNIEGTRRLVGFTIKKKCVDGKGFNLVFLFDIVLLFF